MENNHQIEKPEAELQKTLDDYNTKLAGHREFLEKMKADNRSVSESKPATKPSKKKKKKKKKAEYRSVSESPPATKPSKSPFAGQTSPETDSEATTDEDEADQLLAQAHAQNPGQRVKPDEPEEPSWDEFVKEAEKMKKELQDMNGGRGLEMLDMESVFQEIEKMSEYSKAERDKEKRGKEKAMKK